MMIGAAEHTRTVLVLRYSIYYLLFLALVGLTFSIAVSSIAMGIAIVVWVAGIVIVTKSVWIRTPLDLFFVAYAFAELLSTVLAIEPSASLYNMKRLFLIGIFYLTVFSIDSESKVKQLIGSLVIISVILSTVELCSLVTINGHFERISIFQYYLTEGGLRMFMLLMIIPFLAHPGTPRQWKIIIALCSVVLMLGLIVTQTRSSWLAFIAGVIVIGAVKSKKLIVVLILCIVLFLLVAPSDYRERAASIFDPAMKSNLARIHMITTGWRMFLDYPIHGTGDIDLRTLYETYITPIDSAEGGHLHNNVMMLLVTLGIIGFAATTALFIKIFQIEWRSFRETGSHWLYGSLALGSLAACVGFHVNGLFEWNFGDHEIAVFLWFTVGIALVVQRLFQTSQLSVDKST